MRIAHELPSSSTVITAASRAARKNSPALPIAAFSPGLRATLLAAAIVISPAPSATPSAEFEGPGQAG